MAAESGGSDSRRASSTTRPVAARSVPPAGPDRSPCGVAPTRVSTKFYTAGAKQVGFRVGSCVVLDPQLRLSPTPHPHIRRTRTGRECEGIFLVPSTVDRATQLAK